MPAGWAWPVLVLLFLDEVLAWLTLGYVGGSLGSWPLAGALTVVVIGAWWALAAPKARWGGPVARPVTKVLVFGSACLGLLWVGHPLLAGLLAGLSVVVNGLAATRGVRSVQAGLDR